MDDTEMKMVRFINEFMAKMKRDDVGAHAASAAFFMFLSIFPILMLLCSVLPYTHISEADLLRVVTDLLPSSIDPLAVSVIGELYDQSVAVISVSAVFIIWSAAKGILALVRGLNAVQEVDETRNYFVLRFWSCIYTVILLVLIVFSLIVLVFGNPIINNLLSHLPSIRYMAIILMPFRYLVVIIALALVFALMYALIPNRKNKIFDKMPGAIFASFGWTVFSWAFSMYVERYGSFNMYGSLTTIVIIMLWLYFCMYILLLGDELNHYIQPLLELVRVNRRERREKSEERKTKERSGS
ncbi:MAG: YihY/virulence factor BrkB family protein [bacterium]|nr:YihY/virulence factor BrkB family protein [Clostridium sp.]MCM1538796.1 YihY/virulence factor BrkB family protein [bacterium]